MVAVNLSTRPTLIHGYRSRHEASVQTYRIHAHTLHLFRYDGRIEVNGTLYPIRFGHVGMNPPGANTVYHYETPVCEHSFFHFITPGKPTAFFPVMADLGFAYPQLDVAFSEILALRAVHLLRAEVRLWDLLLHLQDLLRSRDPKDPGAHPALRRAMAFLDARIQDPPRSAEVVAHAGLSHAQLNRLFHKAFGLSMKAWAQGRRMDRARHLLSQTPLSIREIARECGVEDLQQFNKMVRRHFGRPPTALRGGHQRK